MKQIIKRFLNGFCYAVAITMVIQAIMLALTGEPPMLPEYSGRFDSVLEAFCVQLVLIGCMSGITSAGTVIFEAKKIGILVQSVVFLAVMLAAWIPVASFVWGFNKYPASMISTLVSIVVTYGICWGIQYRLCKKEIAVINARLSEKKGE